VTNERDGLGATLEALVPPFDDEAGQWEDVLRRTGPTSPPRRALRRPRIAAAALATVAAVCALVLANPFGGDEKGVLEQALAAVGKGPVLHVVTRTGTVGTLVDLDSGRRTQLRAKTDVWFDPKRGARTTIRLRDFVLADYGAPVGNRLRNPDQALQVFTRDYRTSLQSGRARVLRKGLLAGRPVYWIRVEAGPRAPRGAPCSHMFCNDVAVSRETYQPLYLRYRPGQPGEWILKVESLPAGSGDIPGRHRLEAPGYTILPRRKVDRPEAERVLGKRLAWPGRRIAGLELARMVAVGERPFRYSGRMSRPRWGPRTRVIRLHFRRGNRALVVNEARRPTPGLGLGPVTVVEGSPISPLGYIPREGSMLLTAHGRRAMLRDQGLVIGVLGSSPDLVLAAVQALHR
jgi:hypothetical protein